jgi:uncharacterized membrane protein SpoIIM required for sporulation
MAHTLHGYIASRRPRWQRLQRLLTRLERGRPEAMQTPEVLEVGRLYREATADLARLRAQQKGGIPDELESYLNQLVARAHGQIYKNTPPGWHPLWRFIAGDFPAAFRKKFLWTIAATLIFASGFLYGFFATLTDDAFAPLVVSNTLIEKVESGEVWFDSIVAISPLASSLIMKNNISVTFLAFALGMTFGIGTLYLMVFNGLMVGTLAALCHLHGLDIPFWSFVLPHGIIELTAIFIAGGSGLILASALVAPGDLPRKDALVERGRTAVRLILGCVPLLIVAGVIEGFFSPAALPPHIKFLFAAMAFALLLVYLLRPAK